ncbi:hypothetical protein [Streptomyces sp. Isolate_45]|uniref:hypothetical protein n=1 Tax=unclassified Streptomyces TaxID=2593676 RepID=UPI002481F402|nr:hypothetical protein [Streptomyces sp. Isolate_45]MDA5285525.1 hypothetical protein [Streptomyces sp. Isolate_45]
MWLARAWPDAELSVVDNAGRLGSDIISVAPVLIGSGHRLFGDLAQDVPLRLDTVKDVGGGFAQLSYTVEK